MDITMNPEERFAVLLADVVTMCREFGSLHEPAPLIIRAHALDGVLTRAAEEVALLALRQPALAIPAYSAIKKLDVLSDLADRLTTACWECWATEVSAPSDSDLLDIDRADAIWSAYSDIIYDHYALPRSLRMTIASCGRWFIRELAASDTIGVVGAERYQRYMTDERWALRDSDAQMHSALESVERVASAQ